MDLVDQRHEFVLAEVLDEIECDNDIERAIGCISEGLHGVACRDTLDSESSRGSNLLGGTIDAGCIPVAGRVQYV